MNNISKYCLAMDLLNEPYKISTCIAYNKYLSAEVEDSFRDYVIIIAELFNTYYRLYSTNRIVQHSKALMMHSLQKFLNSRLDEK